MIMDKKVDSAMVANMVGQRLRQLRQAKGFTLDQLSEISGINRGTIHRIELDQVSPRLDTLDQICKALGTDFQGLFQAGGDGHHGNRQDQAGVEPDPPSVSPFDSGGTAGEHDFRHGLLDWMEHLEAVIHGSADGLAVIDREGFVIYESQASIKLRGVSSLAKRSQPWFRAAREEGQAALAESTQGLLRQPGGILRLDYQVLTADGQWRWVRSTLHNQLDNPVVNGIVMNTQDLTDLKLVEEQHRRIQNLEAQLQVVGALTAEFSNLWMGVQGYVDVALMKGLDPNRLAGIRKSLDRARHLLNRMRDVCGHPSLDLGPVDLNQLVREQVSRSAAWVRPPRIVLVELDEALPHLQGDRELLERLLENLFAHLEENQESWSGTLRVLTTIDGVSEAEARERLAGQPFTRESRLAVLGLHAPSGTLFPATGIDGLNFSMTQGRPARGLLLPAIFRTVRDHHGRIEVARQGEEASWIRIYLPLSPALALEPGSRNPSAVKGAILVVDDEESLREATCELLSALGYEALPAGNGQQGLELHAQFGASIQLVLLDLNMPVMNGEEMLKRLREVDPHVKVLLCTGAAGATALYDGRGLNISGILRKPYSYKDLREALAATLTV
jgi:PAS domain S-box-containing protein